jgi:hypothetical protein
MWSGKPCSTRRERIRAITCVKQNGAREGPVCGPAAGRLYSPPFCCATMQYNIGIDSSVLIRDVSMAMRAAFGF